MKQPPNKIYLQWYGDSDEPHGFCEAVETTWCEDRVNNSDVVYVRENWLDRLEKIESAARNLIKVKGRHHTEQAMKALIDAVNMPTF